jgi:hypothetical protein
MRRSSCYFLGHCYVCIETLRHATLTWAVAARLQAEATTHTHIQDARIAAVQHPRPLALASTLTQITNFSTIHHTRPADRAAVAVSEPSTLTGYQPSIDTPWVRTLPSSNPGAEISNAIVSVGTGPQETLDGKLEIRMGEDAGADGGAIPQASQEGDDKASAPDEPKPGELFGDDPYKVEDEETSASKEWEPGERFGIVEDEDASSSGEWEPEVRFGCDPDGRGCVTRRS